MTSTLLKDQELTSTNLKQKYREWKKD